MTHFFSEVVTVLSIPDNEPHAQNHGNGKKDEPQPGSYVVDSGRLLYIHRTAFSKAWAAPTAVPVKKGLLLGVCCPGLSVLAVLAESARLELVPLPVPAIIFYAVSLNFFVFSGGSTRMKIWSH